MSVNLSAEIFQNNCQKFLDLSRNFLQVTKNILKFVCYKCCWLSGTSYRTQISLMIPEKYYYLFSLLTQKVIDTVFKFTLTKRVTSNN